MISKNQIKFIHSLALKKNRQQEGLFIAEGKKVVQEFLQGGVKLHSFYYTKDYKGLIPETLTPNITEVSEEELKKISQLSTPSKVLAVFHQSIEVVPEDIAKKDLGLCLDGINDPGNLGTIIRLAHWFGIKHIICSENSVDVYNPKTVQATMGSLAFVKVHYTNLESFLAKQSCPILAADLEGTSIYDYNFPKAGLLLMGSESHGIQPSLMEIPGVEKITIPNFSVAATKTESLNVGIATGIILSEIKRGQ